MDALEEIKSNFNRLFKDQILNILVKNSNLTDIQLETFIIDLFSEIYGIEKLNYDLKGFFRPKKVTRGSFHRTLQQARKNIVSALFTLLLLIYLGILNEAALNDFKLLAVKLKEYLPLTKTINSIDYQKLLKDIEEELKSGFNKLLEIKNL